MGVDGVIVRVYGNGDHLYLSCLREVSTESKVSLILWSSSFRNCALGSKVINILYKVLFSFNRYSYGSSIFVPSGSFFYPYISTYSLNNSRNT